MRLNGSLVLRRRNGHVLGLCRASERPLSARTVVWPPSLCTSPQTLYSFCPCLVHILPRMRPHQHRKNITLTAVVFFHIHNRFSLKCVCRHFRRGSYFNQRGGKCQQACTTSSVVFLLLTPVMIKCPLVVRTRHAHSHLLFTATTYFDFFVLQ